MSTEGGLLPVAAADGASDEANLLIPARVKEDSAAVPPPDGETAPKREPYAPGDVVDRGAGVLRTYGPMKKFGYTTCGRFWRETSLVLGLPFAVVIFLVYFMAIPAYYTRTLINGRPLSPASTCFKTEPSLCDPALPVQHFMWNLTNAEKVISGEEAPKLEMVGPYAIQLYTKQFNANFSEDQTTVSVYGYGYNEFDGNASCATCSPDDVFVSVNPGYLMALAILGGSEIPLMLGSIPATMADMKETISTYLDSGNSTDAEAAIVSQWANCGVLGVPITEAIPDAAETVPYSPELCSIARAPETPEDEDFLPLPVATAVFNALLAPGTAELFAASSADDEALLAALELDHLDPLHFTLVQSYVFYLAETYAKDDMAAYLGPALGPQSGGLFVARTINEWLVEGFVDPVMAIFMGPDNPLSTVCLYVNCLHDGEIEEIAGGVETTDLPLGIHPGLSQIHVFTGFNDTSLASVVYGITGLEGLPFDGAILPMTEPQFDPHNSSARQLNFSILRSINFTSSGEASSVGGYPTIRFYASPDETAACGDPQGFSITSCIYQDMYPGIFNFTWLMMTPTIFTKPHFLGADRSFAESLGAAADIFEPNPEEHDWYIDMNRRTGLPFKTNMPLQRAHMIRPTDLLYPNLWVDPSEDSVHEGMWLPTHWTAGAPNFMQSDMDAIGLFNLIFEVLMFYGLSFLAVVSAVCGIAALIVTFVTEGGRHRALKLKKIRQSQCPPNRIAELIYTDINHCWFKKDITPAAPEAEPNEHKKDTKSNTERTPVAIGSVDNPPDGMPTFSIQVYTDRKS